MLQADPANNYCADCGTEAPEWASINLGILICIKCSGIHRQLGTHISKVRSTTLDTWDKELRLLMLSLGNTNGNRIFEHELPPNVKIAEDAGYFVFLLSEIYINFLIHHLCLYKQRRKRTVDKR